jgi:4-hydroxy-3-polyprenylbenzoate decarboxylase
VKYVIAITGSSGIAYGVRLLESFNGESILIVSDTAKRMMEDEAGISYEKLKGMADQTYEEWDMFAPVASGSCLFDGMIIAPCTVSTLSKLACGIADNLITRTASVCLKEGRKLVLVPRETPVSQIVLENQLVLARAGATILPASPGFYHRPRSIDDMIDFIVGKILDQMGVENDMFERWGEFD